MDTCILYRKKSNYFCPKTLAVASVAEVVTVVPSGLLDKFWDNTFIAEGEQSQQKVSRW